jgi:hypothetical protein
MRLTKNGDGDYPMLAIGSTNSGCALSVHNDSNGSEFIAEFENPYTHENRKGIKLKHGCTHGNCGHTNQVMMFQRGDGTTQGTITHNSGGSVSYNTSSDYRLKENEVAMSGGLERVNQLKPYRFNWKCSPDKVVDGFFAHEVSDIVPEAIVGEKDAMTDVIPEKLWTEEDEAGSYIPEGKSVGDVKEPEQPSTVDPQQIDFGKLVPLLVASVQELSAKVEALENA